MSQSSEIEALIKLLDDEDPAIYEPVASRLMSYGSEVLPVLEDAWMNTADADLHTRIEALIRNIRLDELKAKLQTWIEDEYGSLLDAFILLTQFHHPDVKKEDLKTQIERIRQKIWLEINSTQTPLENINVFNKVFYHFLGFKGTGKRAIETNDFLLDSILKSKEGTTIGIGMLYLILAQKLDLPVYGVNLADHFILAFQKHHVFDFNADNAEETLFYMNPVDNGSVFKKNDIQVYLDKKSLAYNSSYFSPAHPKAIIKEYLKYLQEFLKNSGKEIRAEEMSALYRLF